MPNKNWKNIQSKKRMQSRNKLAVGVLVLVIGLLLISWTVQFTRSLFNPWQSNDRGKNYIWDEEFNINLLVRTNEISLLSYIPTEGKIIVVNIPDETFVEVPYGFGFWQIRSVFELGQSQKGLGGNKLLKDTLMSFLAIPIDGFLDFSSLPPQKSALEITEVFRKNPVSGLQLLSSLKTDLSVLELLRLKRGIAGVRFDKVKELDLESLGVLEKENLADGTQVFTADPVKLDSILTDLADPKVLQEHKTIAVLNATDRPQFAQRWARLVTNLGGNVIILTNAGEKLADTKVLGIQSATSKRLRQIFVLDCQDNPKCGKINASEEDLSVSRAQINLLLGKDFFSSY